MVRDVNAAALAIADASEGCRLIGYRDPAGIATAGYGHTGPDVIVGKYYTMGEAQAWRAADMGRAASFVAAHVDVPLSDNQFGALVEFTYNVGVGNFLSSTLLRKLNAGDYASVPVQLMRWTRAGGKRLPGLVARRAAEAALFTTPAAGTTTLITQTAQLQAPGLIEKLRLWLYRALA